MCAGIIIQKKKAKSILIPISFLPLFFSPTSTFQNKYTGLQVTSLIEVIPLDVVRPASTSSGGSGDGDGGTIAAIVVPVVVGPILLCLLCLLILIVIVLIIFARRKCVDPVIRTSLRLTPAFRGGEWKPDLTEPDYEALAFGKYLDDPPSVSKKQLAALKKLEEVPLIAFC